MNESDRIVDNKLNVLLVIGSIFIFLFLLFIIFFLRTYIFPTYVEIAKHTKDTGLVNFWQMLPTGLLVILLIPAIAFRKSMGKDLAGKVFWGSLNLVVINFFIWAAWIAVIIAALYPIILRLKM